MASAPGKSRMGNRRGAEAVISDTAPIVAHAGEDVKSEGC